MKKHYFLLFFLFQSLVFWAQVPEKAATDTTAHASDAHAAEGAKVEEVKVVVEAAPEVAPAHKPAH